MKKFEELIESLDKSKLEYFESFEFNESLEEIRKWMTNNNITMIDSNDYRYGIYYGTIDLPIDEDRYFKLTGSIFSKLEGKEDTSIPFVNKYVEYKEWIFSWIHTLNSIHRIELNRSKMRDESIKKIIN